MKLHSLSLELYPNSDVKVEVSLPPLQLTTEDGGQVVTLLMQMIKLYGPSMQQCLEAIWSNPVVGTAAFDQSLKSQVAMFKQSVASNKPESLYAVQCIQQIVDALVFGAKPGQSSSPETGRKALKLAHDLGSMLYCLSPAQYLKPTFLYQSQGTWSVIGLKNKDLGHKVNVKVQSPVQL